MSELLRWLGSLLLRAACRLERRAPTAGHDAGSSCEATYERVFELRTRIHAGYY